MTFFWLSFLPSHEASSGVMWRISSGFKALLLPSTDGTTIDGNASTMPKFQLSRYCGIAAKIWKFVKFVKLENFFSLLRWTRLFWCGIQFKNRNYNVEIIPVVTVVVLCWLHLAHCLDQYQHFAEALSMARTSFFCVTCEYTERWNAKNISIHIWNWHFLQRTK